MAAREVIYFHPRAQLPARPVFPARLLPEPVSEPPPLINNAFVSVSRLFSAASFFVYLDAVANGLDKLSADRVHARQAFKEGTQCRPTMLTLSAYVV